jgi:acyl-CoA thioesterase-2
MFDAEIESLVETLALEPIEVNLFRGASVEGGGPRVFGGHVVAQALLAAYETVETRICHSIHCYFIRPGDPKIPILYEVDRARDGGSFTTRRVTAIQHGEQIFNLAGSFQDMESGLEHQTPAPDLPGPETFPDSFEHMRAMIDAMPEGARRMMGRPRPIEQREIDPRGPKEKFPPICRNWIRARAELPPQPRMHQAAVAYASDMGLLETAMRPHGVSWQTGGLQSASLDHAVWFHRPVNFNDWHLYAQESPTTAGSRGFVRAQMFTREGVLVASVAQEGLVRQRPISSPAG